jgi:hypothetical protein
MSIERDAWQQPNGKRDSQPARPKVKNEVKTTVRGQVGSNVDVVAFDCRTYRADQDLPFTLTARYAAALEELQLTAFETAVT